MNGAIEQGQLRHRRGLKNRHEIPTTGMCPRCNNSIAPINLKLIPVNEGKCDVFHWRVIKEGVEYYKVPYIECTTCGEIPISITQH